jgi:hypothetical protein
MWESYEGVMRNLARSVSNRNLSWRKHQTLKCVIMCCVVAAPAAGTCARMRQRRPGCQLVCKHHERKSQESMTPFARPPRLYPRLPARDTAPNSAQVNYRWLLRYRGWHSATKQQTIFFIITIGEPEVL